MTNDAKIDFLRHLLATLAFRAAVAVRNAPDGFDCFRLGEAIRTPGEILAHMGDLLQGSLFLIKGEIIYLSSAPLPWTEEIARFFAALKDFDDHLASGAPPAERLEKITQGPIADALTHVGQLLLLRRAAGAPAAAEAYFSAEIAPGQTFTDLTR